VSYTELEFNTSTEARKDRLIFMLDTDADDVGIPASQLIDREFGDRQDAFRRRVMDSGLVKQSFDSPARLGWLVERSLRELAETRQRIESGLRREQVPAEPQPVRASRFVNPPPAVAPTWFQDRQIETGVLAHYVTDPGVGSGINGGSDLVVDHLVGMRPGNVMANAFSAGCVSPATAGIANPGSRSRHPHHCASTPCSPEPCRGQDRYPRPTMR
jgi:hypothetical protein